jgi:hypothetical protein
MRVSDAVLKQGVKWIGEFYSAGLGKTLATCSPLKYIHERKGGITVGYFCPNHLTGSIKADFKKFDMPSTWEVIPYSQIHANIRQFDVVIFDEAHYLKNCKMVKMTDVTGTQSWKEVGGSRRSKAAYHIARGAKLVFALSATPYPNDPTELWGVILATNNMWAGMPKSRFMSDVLGCPLEKSYWGEGSHYGEPTVSKDSLWKWMQATGWIYQDKSNLKMPPMTHNVWEWDDVKLTKAEQKVNDQITAIASLEDLSHVSELARYAPLIGKKKAKSASCVSWLEDVACKDEQWVVFYRHRDVLAELVAQCEKQGILYSQIVGGQDEATRNKESNYFIKGINKIIFCNIQASEGWNWQHTNRVAFFELPWNPKEWIQAFERIHRIGQTESCTSTTILCSDADRHIFDLLGDKSKYF